MIHRDVKPPNLILDPLGNIWITDFGPAKFEEGDDLSKSHDLAGTLRYMAPERFRGVSTFQCDVYALGATLYEMMTLRPPFQAKDQLQLIHQVENNPPVPPREIERSIPRDLETIVLKALAKDQADRFGTAREMADELRRFVEIRPIRSRPIPMYQRFWRWCKRDPGLAGASLTAAVLVVVLAVGATLAAWNYRKQLREVEASQALALAANKEERKQLFQALSERARAQRFSRREGQRFQSLAALEEAVRIGRALHLPPERLDPLRDEAIACMALPDIEPTGRVITRPPGTIAWTFDASMTRYALRFRDGTVSVRQSEDDREIARFHARGQYEIGIFELSPEGRFLATRHDPDGALTVWDIERRTVALEDPGPISWKVAARFGPDRRRFFLAHDDGELLVYDLATGRIVRSYRGPGPARHLAVRPDGGRIAAVYPEKTLTCRIIETETGGPALTFTLPSNDGWVTWSPDGTTLAILLGKRISLWDAVTGTQRATLEGHTSIGLHASSHPAGTLLASNGWEGRLWLWDPILGRPWLKLSGGFSSGFSRDGRIVVAREDQLTSYHVDPALEYRTFAHASREPIDYARPSVRHDGRLLAVGTDRGAMIWDLAHGIELAFLPIGNAWNLMFEPSGDLITRGAIAPVPRV